MVVRKKKSKSVSKKNPVAESPVKTTTKSSQDEPLSQDTEKILAALGYPIWIVSLILVLIAKPENKFGKFHGLQGLFWNIFAWIVMVVVSIVLIPLHYIPYAGWIFSGISYIIYIAFLVISIIFAVKAYQGKVFKIPVIYGIVPAKDRL
jgi:uncharacterized membrane protein